MFDEILGQQEEPEPMKLNNINAYYNKGKK